jgi:hypothetical protein
MAKADRSKSATRCGFALAAVAEIAVEFFQKMWNIE